jgi:hypothetical protein
MGCYAENHAQPILEQNMSPPGGDASLTIPKCADTCYRAGYAFLGVQEGNQCWCSSYVGGEWTSKQADCNIPCSGDANHSCGGKGLIDVYRAEEHQSPPAFTISTGTGTKTGTGIATGTSISTSTGVEAAAVSETRSSSGAVRNSAFWWRAQ